MRQLRSVELVPLDSKVMLSMDLDLSMEDGVVADNSRLVKSLPTIRKLLEKKCKIIVVGKLGRPDHWDEKYSLKPVYAELMSLINEQTEMEVSGRFVEEVLNLETVDLAIDAADVVCLENMKFFENKLEETFDLANYLATLAEVYVQDAFAMAHRSGGYMNVARLLPTYFGFDFIREYETMGAVIENPKKPMVVILGGAKIDKLDYLEDLQKIADCIILVGVLPKEVNLGILTPKVIVGSLTANGLDIDESTLNKISPILQTAETIIWAGSAGKWEEEENSMGTRALIQLVEQSGAQKIVAGGDTTAAIRRFGAMDKIDMICSGGGAMLEFLSKKALPAVEIATI